MMSDKDNSDYMFHPESDSQNKQVDIRYFEVLPRTGESIYLMDCDKFVEVIKVIYYASSVSNLSLDNYGLGLVVKF